VGSRILPFRHAADKNFWLDIIRGLERLGHELEVLSVTVEDFPNQGLPLRRVPPIPIYLRPDSRFNPDHWRLAGTNNYASKTITLPRIVRAIRRRTAEFRPDAIHFIDNYGPAMAGLRAALGKTPLTVSAPTYQPNNPLYDLFLQASFLSFDVIVPFSDAYRRRLLDLGFSPNRVRCIRWGVDVDVFLPPTAADQEAARKQLHLDGDELVVLWTGFPQQTDEQELFSAVRTAEVALDKAPSRIAFFLCLKPEHFKETYRRFERDGVRVLGTADAFRTARTCADILLSPIMNTRSTAAPPLVWVECLAMGIPILTTDVPGAGEAVVEQESGFRVRSPEEAGERLLEMRSDPALRRRLREGARRIALERYSTTEILNEYVELWSGLANAA